MLPPQNWSRISFQSPNLKSGEGFKRYMQLLKKGNPELLKNLQPGHCEDGKIVIAAGEVVCRLPKLFDLDLHGDEDLQGTDTCLEVFSGHSVLRDHFNRAHNAGGKFTIVQEDGTITDKHVYKAPTPLKTDYWLESILPVQSPSELEADGESEGQQVISRRIHKRKAKKVVLDISSDSEQSVTTEPAVQFRKKLCTRKTSADNRDQITSVKRRKGLQAGSDKSLATTLLTSEQSKRKTLRIFKKHEIFDARAIDRSRKWARDPKEGDDWSKKIVAGWIPVQTPYSLGWIPCPVWLDGYELHEDLLYDYNENEYNVAKPAWLKG